MRHIGEFDQEEGAAALPNEYYVQDAEMDNSEEMRRQRNEPPSEDNNIVNFLGLAPVFKGKSNKIVLPTNDIYYPGLYRVLRHPKLSVLTGAQHFQCLRVLCAKEPSILRRHVIPLPCQYDIDTEKTLTPLYRNEQKEFIKWAKTLWEKHYIRAVSPKPIIESVYSAEFRVRAKRQIGFPRRFTTTTPVPLQGDSTHRFDMSITSTLIDVQTADLPVIDLPDLSELFTIFMPCSVPEPCNTHPYKLILPNEYSVSTLPIVEIHRELAEFAAKNHSKFIASENAVQCLATFKRQWTLPITVSTAFTPEGHRINVVVLDSEFVQKKEPGMIRAYRACKHLLLQALVPPSEMLRRVEKLRNESESKEPKRKPDIRVLNSDDAESNINRLGLLRIRDEDELMGVDRTLDNIQWNPSLPLGLLSFNENTEAFGAVSLNFNGNLENNINKLREAGLGNEGAINLHNFQSNNNYNEALGLVNLANGDVASPPNRAIPGASMVNINQAVGEPACSCTDAIYEVPAPRSFKKMQVWNHNLNKGHELIVHYSPKTRRNIREMVLEPIIEYQLEIGASEMLPDRVRTLIPSLILRKNAAALLVRIDALNGEVVRYDMVSTEQFMSSREEIYNEMASAIHSVLSKLDGLSPGHYLLKHEADQGTNATLFVAKPSGDYVMCGFENSQKISFAEESKILENPPTIAPVLLPFHKYHKYLPCAFTPYKFHLAWETKKPSDTKNNHPHGNKKSKKRNKRRK